MSAHNTRTSREVLIYESSEVDDVNSFSGTLPNEEAPVVTRALITFRRYLASIPHIHLGNAHVRAWQNYTSARGFTLA